MTFNNKTFYNNFEAIFIENIFNFFFSTENFKSIIPVTN